MPFAKSFKRAMALPEAGEVIGGFTVAQVDVTHISTEHGRYRYPITIDLKGKGGRQAVRRILGRLASATVVHFSSYGNPYQLSIEKLEVQSLGQSRYRVIANGLGARIFLKQELIRFFEFLAANGYCKKTLFEGDREEAANKYLAQYQAETKRKPKRMW